jgi:quinol monooxygenase YgiN
MAVVVVTRLRLIDKAVLDDFFVAAVALLEQAKGSPGVLNADAMAEANDVWWTCTAWADRGAMEAYVRTDPHHATMAKLDGWCDEASFVDWEQADGALPGWQEAYEHLIADGRSSPLSHPSPDNAALAFPPPVLPQG